MLKWVLRAVGAMSLLVLLAFVALRFDSPFGEPERLWAQPWDKVKGRSESLCRTITRDDDDSFVVCMSIERDSYKQLQTSFGLPEPEAVRLKARCAELQYFTPQLRCVEKSLPGSREH